MISRKLKISGLVQGVGFRPYIYHLATKFELAGWVRNFSEGVEVLIQGGEKHCEEFQNILSLKAPPAAEISGIKSFDIAHEHLQNFSIIPSINGTDPGADISPDLAICDSCLEDIAKQPRRKDHLFTSCTHCGPRFSIIKRIPYDRENTSMEVFPMCEDCQREYSDIQDRRFHAQPVACIYCGPEYKLITESCIEKQQEKLPGTIAQMITEGKVIALKGLGGYHLMCDALNDRAVERIRKIKKRDGKPFALLFRDIETVRNYTHIHPSAENLLLSPRSPIVILEQRKPLSYFVNNGLKTIAVMLPYMALHHLLMQKLSIPALVCTSANQSGQSIIADNQEILSQILPFCDGVLIHNRDIIHKQDDSVIRFIKARPVMIRRSRGYAPEPVYLKGNAEGILAMGADMKNCFCIGKNDRAILSQYIGDLENYDVNLHFRKSIEEFLKLYAMKLQALVCDLHPAYHSSRYAYQLADTLSLRKFIMVQHHHAHVASVMAEHAIDEEVIGISMDGTGYGDDGQIWGSEFLHCSLLNYKRICHMEYLDLPGGEIAIKEPWRIAVACLYNLYGEDYGEKFNELTRYIPEKKQLIVTAALKKNLNIVQSCGLGRLFDAVAALLGICHYSNYDGEGPAKLEDLIESTSEVTYTYKWKNDCFKVDSILHAVINDRLDNITLSEIAARFHNTIVSVICDGAIKIARDTGLQKVILSGGSFQNKYLTEKVVKKLEQKGFQVFMNRKVPCNDGGIALGQLAVAMKRRENNNLNLNNYVSEHTGKDHRN